MHADLDAPSPPAAAQRPCPYCGTWNLSDYAYCQKCGKPLPQAVPAGPLTSAPVASTSASIPTATSVPSDSPAEERDLTAEESERLTKSLNVGKAASLRGGAMVCGVLTLTCVGLAFGGILTDLFVYFPVVLVLGLLGIVVGSTARRMREPIQRALSSGTAVELMGVPEVQGPEPKGTRVGIGGTALLLSGTQLGRLLTDRMNRITVADGGPGVGPDRRAGWRVAVVLEWNGAPGGDAERCYIADPGSAGAAAAGGLLGAGGASP